MKLSDAYKIIESSIKNKTPVMLWGPPGIGKSSVIEQIATANKLNLLDLRLAQLEPTDLRGVPMPNRETGYSEWYLPSFWPRRAKKAGKHTMNLLDGTTQEIEVEKGNGETGPGIIFLDEIEKAPVSVKNASLQLVLNRRIGDYHVPNDWSLVCAGNREEDGCFSAPLGSALSNRMIHLEIEPEVDVWAVWARENGVVEDIIGFLLFRRELLYKQTGEHAFPSPRSWVMGSSLIGNIKNAKDQKELLGAAVGKGPAQEFYVWQQVYKNVDPESVLDGNMPEFDKKEQSYKYAVALAVAFHIRKKGIKKKEENIAKFLQILSPELRVIVLSQLTLPCMESMVKHSAFKNMVKEIMKVVS